jgi:hypothetical protein
MTQTLYLTPSQVSTILVDIGSAVAIGVFVGSLAATFVVEILRRK